MPASNLTPMRPIRRRLVRAMRGASVIAILIAALAVALVARGQSEPRVPMLIATALAIGLAVLLGMASVTLIFLGKRSGHQPDAGADPFESNES